jgi:hypothetical protein
VLLTGAALAAALVTASPPVLASLPPLDATSFRPGSCRDAAPALVSLRDTAWQVRTSRRPDVAVASFEVKRAQRALRDVARVASPDVASAFGDVVVAAGFFRIRVDSRTFEPSLAADLYAAYLGAERLCVTGSVAGR